MLKDKPKSGTGEWATKDCDLFYGCENDCAYGYCRYTYTVRLAKRTGKTKDNWPSMVFREKNFNEKPRYVDGRLFCFAHHDIFVHNVDVCIEYMKKWLDFRDTKNSKKLIGYNRILIVTKPRLNCIKKICEQLEPYKTQIVFRFTIGTLNEDVAKFWEPNAPTIKERFASLAYAQAHGYVTSVSCEPYLDEGIAHLVSELMPFVTDTIWVGKLNKLDQRVDMNGWDEVGKRYLKRLRDAQTDDAIKELYAILKDNPKIRWKDSCKQILGLPEEEIG